MFKCPKCNWIGKKPKDKTINKQKYKTCPTCENIVQAYEVPLNERLGRCGNCGGGGFTLAIVNSHLIRKCKACGEVFDTDAGKIIRKGVVQSEL